MTDFCLHVLKEHSLGSCECQQVPVPVTASQRSIKVTDVRTKKRGKYPSRRKCLSAVAFFTPGQDTRLAGTGLHKNYIPVKKTHDILASSRTTLQSYFLESSELWIVVLVMLAPKSNQSKFIFLTLRA